MASVEALLRAARAGSLLSMAGDAVILHGCAALGRRRWATYHRVVAGMSAADMVVSLFYALGDVLMPPPAGSGNEATCRLQGFFLQISLAVPLLNTCLALQYLLLIRYRWSTARLRKLEPAMFAVVGVLALLFAVIPLPLDLYHNADSWCWISDLPRGCASRDSTEPCAAGAAAPFAQLALYYAPLWLAIFATVLIMLDLVGVTYISDRRLAEHAVPEPGQSHSSLTNTRRMMRQAVLYCLAFFLTWVFLTVLRIEQALGIESSAAFQITSTISVTLQGFFNMAVFLLPRFFVAQRYKHAPLRVKLLFVFSIVAIEALEDELYSKDSGSPETMQVEPGLDDDDNDGGFSGRPVSIVSLVHHARRPGKAIDLSATRRQRGNVVKEEDGDDDDDDDFALRVSADEDSAASDFSRLSGPTARSPIGRAAAASTTNAATAGSASSTTAP